MVLDKYCPVSPADWEDLIEFLGAGDGTQFGGRNSYHCRYVIYTDGTNFFAEDGSTGKIAYGGPNNEPAGTVNGADAATVIQAALNGLTAGRTWKEKVVLKGSFTIDTQIEVPSYTEIEIQGRLVDTTPVIGIFRVYEKTHVEIYGGTMVGVNAVNYVGIQLEGSAGTSTTNICIHDIYFDEFFFGVELMSYVQNICIYSLRGKDCTFVVSSIMGTTDSRRLIVDDVIGWQDDGSVRYVVNVDAGWEGAMVSNVIGYKMGAVGIASVKYCTLSNIISIDFADVIRPAINIETTPGYQDTEYLNAVNLIVYNPAYYGVRCGTTGGVAASMNNIKITNCYIESAGAQGIVIYNVRGGQFTNLEVIDSTLMGIELSGDVGPLGMGELQFVQCRSDGGSASGWYLAGNKVGYIELLECIGSNNTNNGLLFAPGAMTGVRVLDGRWEGNVAAIVNPANQIFRNNAGFVTENNVLSPAFAINAIAVVTVTIPHGLAVTPATEDCQLTVVEDTNVDDWAEGYVKVESVGALNVVAKVNVTAASATGGATAKLALHVIAGTP